MTNGGHNGEGDQVERLSCALGVLWVYSGRAQILRRRLRMTTWCRFLHRESAEISWMWSEEKMDAPIEHVGHDDVFDERIFEGGLD